MNIFKLELENMRGEKYEHKVKLISTKVALVNFPMTNQFCIGLKLGQEMRIMSVLLKREGFRRDSPNIWEKFPERQSKLNSSIA